MREESSQLKKFGDNILEINSVNFIFFLIVYLGIGILALWFEKLLWSGWEVTLDWLKWLILASGILKIYNDSILNRLRPLGVVWGVYLVFAVQIWIYLLPDLILPALLGFCLYSLVFWLFYSLMNYEVIHK